MEKCFEEDWARGKCSKFIKSKKQLKKIVEFLKPLYKKIKDFYKHHSSFSSMQTFGLGSNTVIDLFNQMGATDQKYLNTAALGIEMTKSNASAYEDQKSKNNNKSKNFIYFLKKT
jgi:hypothetical protein